MRENVLLLLFVLSSCFYDPPKKGHVIVMNNQSAYDIYVANWLDSLGYPKIYDTFSVNNKPYISVKGNYISRYSKWEYFLTDEKTKEMSRDSVKTLCFYFIKEPFIYKSFTEIKKQHLYDSIIVNVNDVEKEPVNHIFYEDSAIIITHQFDLKNLRSK